MSTQVRGSQVVLKSRLFGNIPRKMKLVRNVRNVELERGLGELGKDK